MQSELSEYAEIFRQRVDNLLLTQQMPGGTRALLTDSLQELLTSVNESSKIEKMLRTRIKDIASAYRHYKDLFENGPGGAAVTDMTGKIKWANRTALKIFATSKNLVMGTSLSLFVADECRQEFVNQISLLHSIPFQHKKLVMKNYLGKPVPALVVGRAIIDIQGKKTGIQWLILELSRHEEKHGVPTWAKEILDAVSDPLLVLDHECNIVKANCAFLQVFRMSEQNLYGRTIYDVFPGIQQNISSSKPMEVDISYDFPAVGSRKMTASVRRVRGNDTAIDHTLFVFKGIPELNNSQVTSSMHKQIEAVADLAGGVAHNFNNLLQIIGGGIQLALLKLEAGEYSTVEPLLRQLLERSALGTETVRRLNDFARLGTDSMNLDTTVFDFSDTVKIVLSQTEPLLQRARDRGAIINVFLELGAECLVAGKEKELIQVVTNCLANAIEAQPSGGEIILSTLVEGDQVILRVRDKGVGIPQSDIGKVFLPFWTTKGFEGRGMGLATAYATVRRHNGELFVDSKPDEGSTFTVKLPLAGRPPADHRPDFERSLNILVIDDMEAVVTMLKEGLMAYGQTVLTALSGKEGIEIFRKKPIDVVLCDLGMEGMNGWDVAKAMQSICLRTNRRKPPFLILTGWCQQGEDRANMLECGVDKVVQKPVILSNLLETIRDLFDEVE